MCAYLHLRLFSACPAQSSLPDTLTSVQLLSNLLCYYPHEKSSQIPANIKMNKALVEYTMDQLCTT